MDRSLSESEESLFSTVFQYKIESYDVSPYNRLEWEERTIRCRLLDLANSQNMILESESYEGSLLVQTGVEYLDLGGPLSLDGLLLLETE